MLFGVRLHAQVRRLLERATKISAPTGSASASRRGSVLAERAILTTDRREGSVPANARTKVSRMSPAIQRLQRGDCRLDALLHEVYGWPGESQNRLKPRIRNEGAGQSEGAKNDPRADLQ